MYTYNDIKNYIKIKGLGHFLLLPIRWIQLRLFVIERGTICYFVPANIPEKKLGQSIIVRRATFNDLDKLREIRPKTKQFRKFLENNDIFVISLIGDKVIGHVCILKDTPEHYKNLIHLKPDEGWLTDALIHPEYRNKGIYSMIFSFAVQIAKKQGFSRVYGYLDKTNQKSIEIHTKKFGWNPVFNYKYLKFLFFEKTWIQEIKIEM